MHKQSYHPPTIIKEIPKMTVKRIWDISCNKQHFNKAKSLYQDAPKTSAYTEKLVYSTNKENKNAKQNRPRKIIWFSLHSPAMYILTLADTSGTLSANISLSSINSTLFQQEYSKSQLSA